MERRLENCLGHVHGQKNHQKDGKTFEVERWYVKSSLNEAQ